MCKRMMRRKSKGCGDKAVKAGSGTGLSLCLARDDIACDVENVLNNIQ